MHTDTAAADEATIQALSATATAPGAASVLIEELQDASSSNAAQAPTLSSSDIMRFHHQGFKLVDVVQLTQKVNRHALDAAHACTVKSQQDADSLGRPRSPSQAAGVGAGGRRRVHAHRVTRAGLLYVATFDLDELKQRCVQRPGG